VAEQRATGFEPFPEIIIDDLSERDALGIEDGIIASLGIQSEGGRLLNKRRSGINAVSKGLSVTVAGVEYPSRNAAARYYGINSGTLSQRISDGWSLEQALGLREPPPKEKKDVKGRAIACSGIEFPSVSAFARYYGIDRDLISTRKRAGWSPEQMAGIIPPPGNGKGQKKENRTYSMSIE
jgi:hypothetical protein